MLNLRSENWKEFSERLVYVVLLCLAAHCVAAFAQGLRGGEMFAVGVLFRPVRLLIAVAAIGCVTALSWPKKASGEKPAESAEEEKPVPPALEQSVPPPSVPEPAPPEPSPHEQPTPEQPPPEPAPPEQTVSKPIVREPPVVDRPPEVRPTEVHDEPSTSSRPSDAPRRSKGRHLAAEAMAERMWRKARSMAHNFIPDMAHDGRYLGLLHGAAMAGHGEALSKLAEYAFRRGVLVEAYYWMKLAQLNGMPGLEARMRECVTRWTLSGCRTEHENVYKFFTERQSALGRAALRLDACVYVDQALARLTEMAKEGDPVAAMILDMRERNLEQRKS